MIAALFADVGRRRRGDHRLQRRHHEHVLSAVAPREAGRVTADLVHPPAVPVLAVAQGIALTARLEAPRPVGQLARAAGARLPHPGLRHDLAAVDPAAVQIEPADVEQLARRHQHVVAAEVDALRIGGPRRQREAERPGQRGVGELSRAHAGGPREDRRQQVRVAGAVVHRHTGRREHRARQRVVHPVAARHPGAVLPAARAFEARPHREQVFDGDAPLCGVGRARRKVGGDGRADTGNQPAFDGDADEGRDHALRR